MFMIVGFNLYISPINLQLRVVLDPGSSFFKCVQMRRFKPKTRRPGVLHWELKHSLSNTERLIHHTWWDSIHRSRASTVFEHCRVLYLQAVVAGQINHLYLIQFSLFRRTLELQLQLTLTFWLFESWLIS